MQSGTSPSPPHCASYLKLALNVQGLWLSYATLFHLALLERLAGFTGVELPAFVALLCGPAGWALVAVSSLLVVHSTRRRPFVPAYPLAVYALLTAGAFSLFTWEVEATLFRTAAAIAGELPPALPESAPSDAQCAAWLRHRYELMAEGSAFQVQEPSSAAVLDCRLHRSPEELACGLQATALEDVLQCAARFEHGAVL